MAIMDYRLEFSDNQDLASTAASTASTNVIDLGAAKSPDGVTITPDVGMGTPVYVHCVANTAPVAANYTTTTLKIELKHSPSTTAGSFTLLQTVRSALQVSTTNFPVNVDLANFSLPMTTKRYLKMIYTIGACALSVGKFDAWIDLSMAKQAAEY
jgi:hypothetical protein